MKSVAPSWLFLRKVGGRREGWLRVGDLGYSGAEARGGGEWEGGGLLREELGFRNDSRRRVG